MAEQQHYVPFPEIGITPDELAKALAEQKALLLWRLGKGRTWAFDDLQAQVALETTRSLGRWVECGRPPLGGWARSVAERVFLTWTRSPDAGVGPGRTSLVSADSLAEDGVQYVAVEPSASEREAVLAAYALIARLQELVLSRPGGAETWREMVTEEMKPRGLTAQARLRQLVELAVDPDGELRRAAGLTTHDHLIGDVA